jgi:hypothetical protein
VQVTSFRLSWLFFIMTAFEGRYIAFTPLARGLIDKVIAPLLGDGLAVLQPVK